MPSLCDAAELSRDAGDAQGADILFKYIPLHCPPTRLHHPGCARIIFAIPAIESQSSINPSSIFRLRGVSLWACALNPSLTRPRRPPPQTCAILRAQAYPLPPRSWPAGCREGGRRFGRGDVQAGLPPEIGLWVPRQSTDPTQEQHTHQQDSRAGTPPQTVGTRPQRLNIGLNIRQFASCVGRRLRIDRRHSARYN